MSREDCGREHRCEWVKEYVEGHKTMKAAMDALMMELDRRRKGLDCPRCGGMQPVDTIYTMRRRLSEAREDIEQLRNRLLPLLRELHPGYDCAITHDVYCGTCLGCRTSAEIAALEAAQKEGEG